MKTRRHAREAAVQMLFQRDLNADTTDANVREYVSNSLQHAPLEKFALELIDGVRGRLAAIARSWAVTFG